MKYIKQRKALLTAVLVVLSIFFAFAPVASAAGHTVVSISTDAGAEHGATTTVPIIADDEGSNMCLGQSTINVTFDPSVVNVTKVATGSGNALAVVASNIQNGWVTLASVDGSVAHNGTVTLANVTFEAVGYPPDTSPLNITVETLADWYDYSDITHTISNGTITVLGGPEQTSTATPISRSRGGGSGASSKVTLRPTSTPVSSSTPRITQTPASASVSETPSPHVTSSPTPTITQTPSSTSTTPGFDAVSAIAGLLAIAYFVLRRE